jgi:hypothetical protein
VRFAGVRRARRADCLSWFSNHVTGPA